MNPSRRLHFYDQYANTMFVHSMAPCAGLTYVQAEVDDEESITIKRLPVVAFAVIGDRDDAPGSEVAPVIADEHGYLEEPDEFYSLASRDDGTVAVEMATIPIGIFRDVPSDDEIIDTARMRLVSQKVHFKKKALSKRERAEETKK